MQPHLVLRTTDDISATGLTAVMGVAFAGLAIVAMIKVLSALMQIMAAMVELIAMLIKAMVMIGTVTLIFVAGAALLGVTAMSGIGQEHDGVDPYVGAPSWSPTR